MSKKLKVFTEGAVRRLVEQAKASAVGGNGVTRGPNGTTVQQSRNPIPSPTPRRTPSPILAKITAVDVSAGEFSLTEVFPDGEAKTTPRVWDGGELPNLPKARNVYGVPVAPVDAIYQLHSGLDSSDPPAPYWWFEGVKPMELFPVDLEGDGGDTGDLTTQCSRTYTVDDLDGNELGTTVSPEHQRPAIGKMLDATTGMAYYTPDGTLKLQATDEVLDLGDCDGEP